MIATLHSEDRQAWQLSHLAAHQVHALYAGVLRGAHGGVGRLKRRFGQD